MFSNYIFRLGRSGDISSLALHSKKEGSSQVLRFSTGSRADGAPWIDSLCVVDRYIHVGLVNGLNGVRTEFKFEFAGNKQARKALHSLQSILWPRRFRLIKIAAVIIASLFVLDQIASATMGEMVRQAQLESAQQQMGAIATLQEGGSTTAELPTEPYRFDPRVKVPEVKLPELSCAK